MARRAVSIALVAIQGQVASSKWADPFRGRAVRIWSDEWRSWWRPDAQGYTREEREAGLYTFEDAVSRTHHCGQEKRIVYELVGGWDQ